MYNIFLPETRKFDSEAVIPAEMVQKCGTYRIKEVAIATSAASIKTGRSGRAAPIEGGNMGGRFPAMTCSGRPRGRMHRAAWRMRRPHISTDSEGNSPAPFGRGLGGGVCARQRPRESSVVGRPRCFRDDGPLRPGRRVAGVMRACRRETRPPNPCPQGAGEWIELWRGNAPSPPESCAYPDPPKGGG
jgi:hypothetical protein